MTEACSCLDTVEKLNDYASKDNLIFENIREALCEEDPVGNCGIWAETIAVVYDENVNEACQCNEDKACMDEGMGLVDYFGAQTTADLYVDKVKDYVATNDLAISEGDAERLPALVKKALAYGVVGTIIRSEFVFCF